MAAFAKVENPWRKEVQKIPTKDATSQIPKVQPPTQPNVILGPYNTSQIESNNKKSTSPPPVPAYLTVPPREKVLFARTKPAPINNVQDHFAAIKQILINCITLRNLRIFFRHVSPRGTFVLCVFLAAIFLVVKVYTL